MKYYLYVLKLNSTGHFYIGVTNNLVRRHQQHFLNIKSAIELCWPKKQPQYNNMYIVFSKEITPLIKKWADLKKVIDENYSFYVKYVCQTPYEISKKETNMIRRHKNNPLLLNSSLKSTYAANKVAKRVAATGR